MKILITGVKGFMGTNFTEHYLKDANHTVVGISTEPDNIREQKIIKDLKQRYQGRFSFYACDITDSGMLEPILNSEKPELILNFASQAEVIKSFEQPYEFLKSNLEGVVHVLEWLRHSGKGTSLIHFSTEAVYGAGNNQKSKESDPLYPQNPYAASKAAAEQYVFAYNFCFNTNVRIARLVNTYGPYQNSNKLIAKTIIRCINNEPFKLYAEPNSRKRNWLYVEDACKAVDVIISKGDKDGIYNIPSLQQFTTEEVVMRILDLFGKKSLFEGYAEERLNDQEHYALDESKLMSLGWKQEYSLDDGLKKTIEWFKNNPEWSRKNDL